MNRRLFPLFAAAFGLCLASCDSFDVKHPTVSQMDELDVQWGLPRRVPKGGAKRLLNAEAAAAIGVTGTSVDSGAPAVGPAPAAAGTAPAPAPAPATMPTNPAASAPATNTVDPSVINTLR